MCVFECSVCVLLGYRFSCVLKCLVVSVVVGVVSYWLCGVCFLVIVVRVIV